MNMFQVSPSRRVQPSTLNFLMLGLCRGSARANASYVLMQCRETEEFPKTYATWATKEKPFAFGTYTYHQSDKSPGQCYLRLHTECVELRRMVKRNNRQLHSIKASAARLSFSFFSCKEIWNVRMLRKCKYGPFGMFPFSSGPR